MGGRSNHEAADGQRSSALAMPDLWTGLVLIAVALALLIASFDIRVDEAGLVGPRAVPQAVCVLLLIAGAALSIASARRAGQVRAPEPSARAEPSIPWRALLLAALGLAFVPLFGAFGYLGATGLVTAATLALFGVRRSVVLVCTAAVAAVVWHLAFVELMDVFAPAGRVFDAARLLPF